MHKQDWSGWPTRRMVDMLERATRFEMCREPGGGPSIEIEARDQRDGSRKWVVKRLSSVLNKSGRWEWEPNPSARTDEFIARTRLTLDHALMLADEAIGRVGIGSEEDC